MKDRDQRARLDKIHTEALQRSQRDIRERVARLPDYYPSYARGERTSGDIADELGLIPRRVNQIFRKMAKAEQKK